MIVRKLYIDREGVKVTIPRDVRRKREWANVKYVAIEYHPPFLVMRPLTLEELMTQPTTEEEELPADALSHTKP